MMDVRWISGILLIAVCAAVINSLPIEENTVYVYDYHGRIATGITQQTQQFSGFDIKAKITLRKDGRYVHLQVTDTIIGSLNQRVKGNLLDEFQYDYSTPSAHESVLIHNLQKPVRISYGDGTLKSFDAFLDEPQWSVNVKKAILSLFQINLSQQQDGIFTVDEDSIYGLCKTNYNVKGDEDNLLISKFRLLDQCVRGQSLFYANFWGKKCQSENQQERVKRTSYTNYVISGEFGKYVIKNVTSEGLIYFLPFGPEGEHFVSAVNQSLILRVSDKSNDRVRFTERFRTYNSLEYNFYAVKNNGYQNRLADIDYDNAFEKAQEILETLMKDHDKRGNHSDYYFTEKISTLLQYLPTFEKDDFRKLALNLNQMKNFGEIFTFVLPLVGTTAANQFILSLPGDAACGPQREYCINLEIDRMMTVLPFFMKEPTRAFIDEFRETFHLTPRYDVSEVKVDNLLHYGNILYRACYSSISEYSQQNEKNLNKEDCSKYVKELLELSQKQQTAYGKQFAIAALINTRSPDVLNEILKAIHDKDGIMSRRLAITGTLNFQEPDQITKIRDHLENFIQNKSEDYVLRTYAYEVLLKLAPNNAYLTELIKKIFAESNKQLLTYLYDVVSNIAQSSDFCSYNKKTVNHLKVMLKYIQKPQYSNLLYSGQKSIEFHNEKYSFGREAILGWIGGKTTAFPTELYFEENLEAFGQKYNVLKIGVLQSEFWHVDALPAAVFGPFNLLDVPVYNRRIQEKIVNPARPLVERKPPNTLDMNHIGGYFIILNQYIGFNAIFYQAFKHYATFVYSEVSYDLPNDMGFPVTLDHSDFYLNDFDIDLKEPESNDMNKNSGETKPKTFKSFEIVENEDYLVRFRFAVINPAARAYGFGITTRGSTKFSFTGTVACPTTFEDKELKFSVKIPSKPFLLSKLSSKPFTFIYNLNDVVPDESGNSVVEIGYLPRPILKSYRLGHDYFGVGININITRSPQNQNWLPIEKDFSSLFSPIEIFNGLFELNDFVYFNPSIRPLDVKIMIEPNSLHPTKEFQFEIKLHKLLTVPISNAGGKLMDLAEISDDRFLDIQAHLTAVGPIDRSWKGHFRLGTLAPRGEPKNSFLKLERSPIPNYDTDSFMVCYQRRSTVSKLTKAHQEMLADLQENHAATLKYGPNCEKEISIQVNLRKSDEEKAYVTSKEVKQLFRQCRQELILKKLNSECWKKASEILSLRKASIEIDFQKENSFLTNLPNALLLLKNLYPNIVASDEEVSNSPNQITINANQSREYPLVDVSVSTPNQNLQFYGIEALSTSPYMFADGFLQKYTRTAFSPYVSCKIANSITTFDEVQYKAELYKCYYMLAMDCSYSDSFAVLGRSTNNPTYTKAVKIFLRNYTIELVPTEIKDPKKGATMNLIVNGEKKNDPKYQRYFEPDPDDKNVKMFEVYFYMGHYMIILYRESVQVDLGAVYIDIQISHMYRGRMCGICGDFNLEQKDEFLGSDLCLYRDAEKFVSSYVIGDGTCSTPKVNQCGD